MTHDTPSRPDCAPGADASAGRRISSGVRAGARRHCRKQALEDASVVMSLEKFRPDGQTAIVTGGSKGLGQAMACAMADAGANIVLISRNRDEAITAAQAIQARGW